MSLFDDASLVTTPNGYKASKLYSIKPTSGLGDMTVTRATTATRVNSSNVIESVAINVPRLDYTLGSCPSILIEDARTNLVFPSATLTTQTRTVTAVANTLSFYGTGTIVLSGVHTATLTGTGANDRVSLTFTPTAGSLILTVTGTVTNAQLEVGSNASSYIPTVTATVTRNADVISKTGVSSLIGQTEGTIFMDLNFTNVAVDKYIMVINNTANTNSIAIRRRSTGVIRVLLTAPGSVGTTNESSAVLADGNYKIAYKYISGEIKLFINGAISFSLTPTFTFGAAIENIKLGMSNSNSEQLNDTIKSLQLYTTALTDAQCITLTTP